MAARTASRLPRATSSDDVAHDFTPTRARRDARDAGRELTTRVARAAFA
jgi:hypothetical protein